ncbi:6-phosphogluconolactonase [Microcella humidisoli]|uniref:6-phosphogluconolactonase n=1 Tax=Microcella humidisoli TaxID=2963406 RepID=A0ABY5FZW7_9MICO|nr:6-phosphogluconolactonase [Microcella humidisoli]UTT63686.1 6-phosphogluconolactonase [Microcella humidisoli]
MRVGIDAGASKIRVGVFHKESLLGERTTKGVLVHDRVSAELAATRIRKATDELLASVVPVRVSAVCAGAAGVDSDASANVFQDALRQLFPHPIEVVVVNDGLLLAVGAEEAPPLIALSLGTGSVAWSVGRDETYRRAGGLGWLISDEGSACDVVLQFLTALAKTIDVDSADPRTLQMTCAQFGVTDAMDVFSEVLSASSADIASHAPFVFELAARGDHTAAAAIDSSARRAVELYERLAQGMGSGVAIALSGGLARAQPQFAERVVALSGASRQSSGDPLLGAARIAGRASPGGAGPLARVLTMPDPGAVARAVVDRLVAYCDRTPHPRIVLPTGDTMRPVYSAMRAAVRSGRLSLSAATLIQLDEMVGVKQELSFLHILQREILDHLESPPAGLITFDSTTTSPKDETSRVASLISEIGGCGIALVGIGANGHIGYNEPGSDTHTSVRVVELEESTSQTATSYFSDFVGEKPRLGMTLGIKDIAASEEILVIATGFSKSTVVAKSLLGPKSPALPASQICRLKQTITVLDTYAASTLRGNSRL